MPKFTLLQIEVAPVMLPIAAIATTVVDINSAVLILLYLFLFDFATGLAGSYFEWKKLKDRGRSFFGCDKGFSSDKFKMCFMKGIIYAGFPLVVLKFQQAFMLKNISFKTVTDSQIEVTTVFILIFCANELYSIFWENLPKSGLNLPKGIKNLVNKAKEFLVIYFSYLI